MVGSSGEVAFFSPVMIIRVLRDMPASTTQSYQNWVSSELAVLGLFTTYKSTWLCSQTPLTELHFWHRGSRSKTLMNNWTVTAAPYFKKLIKHRIELALLYVGNCWRKTALCLNKKWRTKALFPSSHYYGASIFQLSVTVNFYQWVTKEINYWVTFAQDAAYPAVCKDCTYVRYLFHTFNNRCSGFTWIKVFQT